MPSLDAFFLPLGLGSRLCILHTPDKRVRTRGAILFVHAFAEEMNKSRRMAALQARAFASAGWIVLQIDLFGCGDSSGDFSDATWQLWTQDILDAQRWLAEKTGHEPVLWGLRGGCLLITEAAGRIDRPQSLLLWQPVLSGKQLLQQFLRLKIVNQLTAQTTRERSGTQELRSELARGAAIEVAGYTISPALALPMEGAELTLPAVHARVAWLQVSGSANEELAPASRNRIATWHQDGHHVKARVVSGPPFWQTLEISECPALLDASIELLSDWGV